MSSSKVRPWQVTSKERVAFSTSGPGQTRSSACKRTRASLGRACHTQAKFVTQAQFPQTPELSSRPLVTSPVPQTPPLSAPQTPPLLLSSGNPSYKHSSPKPRCSVRKFVILALHNSPKPKPSCSALEMHDTSSVPPNPLAYSPKPPCLALESGHTSTVPRNPLCLALEIRHTSAVPPNYRFCLAPEIRRTSTVPPNPVAQSGNSSSWLCTIPPNPNPLAQLWKFIKQAHFPQSPLLNSGN